METLKNSLTTIIQFFKRLKIKTKEITTNSDHFEFKHTPFGVNFNQNSESKKSKKSLLTQMYSDENDTLFI